MAAGRTYTPIERRTLQSDTASVTFSNISGSYTDLIAICDVKGGDANLVLRFNSDSGSNYSATALAATNSNQASSFRNTSQTSLNNAGSAYMFTLNDRLFSTFHIMNYSNTSTYKLILSRGNNPPAGVDLQVGVWRSTSAITSIEFIGQGSNLYAGSIINLYGIAAA